MSVTYRRLREWVLALPGTREVVVERWDHPTLRYGDRMFASGSDESGYATVKASLADQAELIATAPDVYAKAAYVGRFGWVRVDLAAADPGELRRLVIDAWRRTAPKRVVRAYDDAHR